MSIDTQTSPILRADSDPDGREFDTLDALEDMLASYDGTVLIVSHDRAFLDGVATQIVGPLGGGHQGPRHGDDLVEVDLLPGCVCVPHVPRTEVQRRYAAHADKQPKGPGRRCFGNG